MTDHLGSVRVTIAEAVRERASLNLDRLTQEHFFSRLFVQDETLWQTKDRAEARIRMGWVDAPETGEFCITAAETARDMLLRQGVERFVLCGMGGSSLGPEMLAREAGVALAVLDSTDPRAVRAALEYPRETAVIVSSKSGTTVETRSHLAAFERAFADAGISPADRIIVVTDPGSDLANYANHNGYRLILADPNVGGRFSVLTAYGLVPAVLAGVNARVLLSDAHDVKAQLTSDTATNPAALVAAAAVELKSALLFGAVQNRCGFIDWIEQLVAESTGKDGVGVLPVTLPPGMSVQQSKSIDVVGPLGARILTWEVATAAMGWLLDVNPFDQPDVERSKAAARGLLSESVFDPDNWGRIDSAKEVSQQLTDRVSDASYIAIQVFGVSDTHSALRLQAHLMVRFGLPVTFGTGPRFLHSTGQLHKGGPRNGLFLQISPPDTFREDVQIPGQRFSFGELLLAQAQGDAEVLAETGQSVICTTASTSELLDAFTSQV